MINAFKCFWKPPWGCWELKLFSHTLPWNFWRSLKSSINYCFLKHCWKQRGKRRKGSVSVSMGQSWLKWFSVWEWPVLVTGQWVSNSTPWLYCCQLWPYTKRYNFVLKAFGLCEKCTVSSLAFSHLCFEWFLRTYKSVDIFNPKAKPARNSSTLSQVLLVYPLREANRNYAWNKVICLI